MIRLGEDAYGVPISREIEANGARRGVWNGVRHTGATGEKGLVRSKLGDATPERGGRAKRYFRATATGLRTVRETKQSLMRLLGGLWELEGRMA